MRISPEHTILLAIDIQERLMPVMDRCDQLLGRISLLLEGCRVLDLPALASEQYPKGLGPTVTSVREALGTTPILPKIEFSCLDNEAIRQALAASSRTTVIVCGVESHVCVLQTVIDLQAAGYRAVVPVDAVGSRKDTDRAIAIERMRAEGAIITSVESVLFEMTRAAGTERFKAISRLVK